MSLQPVLLDRLTVADPTRKQESRADRVLSISQYRDSVIRDLAWLLSTTNLAARRDLGDEPEVANSVLNYGMPDFCGQTASTLDVQELERAVRVAIELFEPRLIKKTLKVKAVSQDAEHNALSFQIEAELWAQPLNERLFLKTDLDLETGMVSIQASGGDR